jgi:hypothetical protein
MTPARLAAIAAAMAALVLTGCSSQGGPQAAPSSSARVSPSASLPEGCAAAMVVVSTVRSGIRDGSMSTHSAIRQLDSVAGQIPQGQLRLDLDKAAYDLSQYALRAAFGEGGGKWARRFAADLDKISRECQAG